jgi:SAM-dependent methyltransferase
MRFNRLVRKGLQNPKRIPPYIIGRVFPNSRFGPDWQRKNGVITWGDNWEWGNESPPDISATDYYHHNKLNDLFEDRNVENALEVGCGYGRVLPWIAESTGANVRGIDANPDAISTAREHYPDFQFDTQDATSLSYDENSFDLVLTWTVLHHIPPKQIDAVTNELERVLEPEGLIVSLENTKGEGPTETVWPRSVSEYSEKLQYCNLIETHEYDLPHTDRKSELQILVFRMQKG